MRSQLRRPGRTDPFSSLSSPPLRPSGADAPQPRANRRRLIALPSQFGRGGVGSPAYDRSVAKARSQFVCSECGHARARLDRAVPRLRGLEHAGAEERADRPGRRQRIGRARRDAPSPTPLRAVEADRTARLLTGIDELDRVLGGGTGPRLPGPARGRPRHREEHPRRDGPRQCLGGEVEDALRLGRGVPRPDPRPGRAPGGGRPRRPGARRALARGGARDARGGAPGGLRDRLGPDPRRRRRVARQRRGGPRGDRRA